MRKGVTDQYVGVPDAIVVSVVPNNVKVVGSSLTAGMLSLVGSLCCAEVGERKAQERELASSTIIDRYEDGHKKLKQRKTGLVSTAPYVR